jgi:hypothetical protein
VRRGTSTKSSWWTTEAPTERWNGFAAGASEIRGFASFPAWGNEVWLELYYTAGASRYSQDHGTKGWNPLRAAVSRLSTLAAAPLIHKKNLQVTDPMSGFFIIHRRCIEGLIFQTTGFKLLLEILVRGRIKVAREVAYHFGLRRAGRSKANATVAFHYLHLLGRLSRDLVLRSSEL